MRFKKSLLAITLAISVFGFSQSAFGLSGWADSYPAAQPLQLGGVFNMNLDLDYGTGVDSDWYSYTNTSGGQQNIIFGAAPIGSSNTLNLEVNFLIKNPDGSIHPGVTLPDTGPGMGQYTQANIGSGTTILWRVSGRNPSVDGGMNKPYQAYVIPK